MFNHFIHCFCSAMDVDHDTTTMLSFQGRHNNHHLESRPSAMQNQLSAIEHNNYAVQVLKKGSYVEAFQLLNRALKLCRQSTGEAPLSSLLGEDKRSHPGLEPFLSETPLRCADNSTESFLCDHLVTIPRCIDSSYDGCVLVSTLITFNFSLANHMAGLVLMDSSPDDDTARTRIVEQHLKMAATSYVLAYSMQQTEGFEESFLFQTAIFYNLGLVYSRLGEQYAAHQCWDNLWSVLSDTPTTSNSNRPGLLGGSTRIPTPSGMTTTIITYYRERFGRDLGSSWPSNKECSAAAA